MAKFGEGDDRWIVKDLGEDGTNVNNWHWKEYDALEWSQEKLSAMFTDMCLVETPALSMRISAVASKGEAVINNRKNKLIPAYELDITFNWKAQLDGSGGTATCPAGRINLPYVSDENHDEVPEMRFSGEADDAATQRVREAFLSEGKALIVKSINEFVSELRSGGPMKPGSKGAADAAAAAAAPPKAKLSSAKADEVKLSKVASGASKTAGRSLSMTEKYYARPADLYECFVVEGKVKAFTQSNAAVEPRPGGKFSWFNGSVVGEFLELEADKKLVMHWRFSTWKEGCNSKVTISLESPEPGTTILTLHQTGIPEEDAYGQAVMEHTENGWKGQIFSRIRQVFGYGV